MTAEDERNKAYSADNKLDGFVRACQTQSGRDRTGPRGREVCRRAKNNHKQWGVSTALSQVRR